MSSSRPITLLHLSDPQFGKNHRFAQQDLSAWDAPFDTLLSRLTEDLKALQEANSLVSDLLIITGDLAEWGLRSEFEDALKFLSGLCDFLELPRNRVAIIPGNHDINRQLCAGYFVQCEGEEREPAFPYWPKWKPYTWFFQEFYADIPGINFIEELPWSLFEMPDLKVVVAGLNSTMQESHRPEDHHGRVGERQLQWFRDKLQPYGQRGWLRIGAVHHNLGREALDDAENLSDAEDLQRILGSSLNFVLHGHTHNGKSNLALSTLPILSTGSAAVKPEQSPTGVPNQYQIIQAWSDRLGVWARSFAFDRKRWIGDTRVAQDGSRWWDEKQVTFIDVWGTFPEQPAERSGAMTPEPHFHAPYDFEVRQRGDDFLDRVEKVCRLHEPEALVERIPGTGACGDYLRVCHHKGGIATVFPVGATEQEISRETFEMFVNEVDMRYRRSDRQLVSVLVYGGEEQAPKHLMHLARDSRVHLLSFVEYQGLIDFRSYIKQQTEKLGEDPIYPPALYVPQRMRFQISREEEETSDALGKVQEWLSSPSGRLIVLIGDFGTGKTFLLHELARRLGEQNGSLVPILLQMGSLEKGRDLDSLLAQHFAQEEVEDFSPRRFRYMLEQGRVVLLFDGFDELALRVTYQRATDHFDTLLQAATGNAKVVVTSRRQHFLSDQQVKTALTERVELVTGHRLSILQPFNRDQIRGFLVKFCKSEEHAERRLGLIDHVKDLLGLSHNPRLLGFIAELPEEKLLEAANGEGEITAARLYELLLDRWLILEFERVHPRGAPPGLSVEDRWRGVTALALRLWQKTEASMSLDELTKDAARVVEALPFLDPSVAAFQLGSGTLLSRDANGNFSFLHQSVLEWLVARSAADQLKLGRVPECLRIREISPLMADFLSDLAGKQIATDWAYRVLAEKPAEAAKNNALLVLERLGVTIRKAVYLSGQDLRGKDLSYQDLTGTDLSGADLTGARLVETLMASASLAEAKLLEADLTGALLRKADLFGANFMGARLMGADLRGAHFRGTILRRAKLLASEEDPGALSRCDTFGAALEVPFFLSALIGAAGSIPYAVAFSQDAQLLAGAEGRVIRIWEASTGREIRRIGGHKGTVRSIAFSPNGKLLASGSHDNTVRLWEISNGHEIQCFYGHENWIRTVAFSPEASMLASGSHDNTVRLWEVSTGREIRRLQGHNNGSLAVAFSPDGKILASGCGDNTVRLYDILAGIETAQLHGHQHRILSVAFSPDGKHLASASGDKTVRLWELSTRHQVREFRGCDNWVRSIAFSLDGATLAIGSDDNIIRLWEISTGREIRKFQGHQNSVLSVAFSPNGQTLASSSYDETVRLWEANTGKEIRRVNRHLCGVASLSFSHDGKILASGSVDNIIRLWEVKTGREIKRFQPGGNRIAGIIFDSHREFLASCMHENTFRLWQVNNGQELWRIAGHSNRILSLAFSSDGQTFATSSDNTILLFEMDGGREIRRFQEHNHPVLSLAFTLNGQYLASGSEDNTVRLWEVDTGREIRRFHGHSNQIRSLAFSPDGQYLASGSEDNTALLLEVETGREIRRFHGHEKAVKSIAFSPDGQSLASGSDDNTIRLWDIGSSTCVTVLGLLPEGWVAFSPDGRYKLGGIPAGGFWHVINLCRFEAGELDDWIPGLRLPDDASFFDLPPWKPEARKPKSLRRESPLSNAKTS
ncbi:MAG TPA: pentapeptide repeat-containing protein [Thermoanaerobaculia bacterium]|nr:pentapeptide repeat-containing protein [Thermoanaerobaculia bacterium]